MDDEEFCVPDDVLEEANAAKYQMVPTKSKLRYQKELEIFTQWQTEIKGKDESSISAVVIFNVEEYLHCLYFKTLISPGIQARLRREYLYRKTVEDKQKSIQEKKDRIKRSLDENIPIHGDLQKSALHYSKKAEWEDAGPQAAVLMGGESGGALANSQDDEYRYAGVEDPKIVITTSRDPSSRLKMFVKEMRLIFPNAQRMNRGNYEMKQLIHACRANDVTDFIVVHEHRGVPDSLVICHLPYGPTTYFTMSDVVMRHDIPDLGTMSEQYPHLIFHNFKTKLGERVTSILKYLFPVPKEDSKRVITFANHDDYISFRHHTYKKVGKQIELSEVGPRFQLRLYEIKLGTLDNADAADTEWALRPYMNTTVKRRFFSDDDGWLQDDEITSFCLNVVLMETINLEVTGVSRSGRVRKKSSKLVDFESPDEIDRSYKRQGAMGRKSDFEVQPPRKLPRPEDVFIKSEHGFENYDMEQSDSEYESEYELPANTESSIDSVDTDSEFDEQETSGFKRLDTDTSKKRFIIKDGRIVKPEKNSRGGKSGVKPTGKKTPISKSSPGSLSYDTSSISPPSPRGKDAGYKVNGIKPIDVAAHLKLLGESLTIIGERLKEHEVRKTCVRCVHTMTFGNVECSGDVAFGMPRNMILRYGTGPMETGVGFKVYFFLVGGCARHLGNPATKCDPPIGGGRIRLPGKNVCCKQKLMLKKLLL
ncbi:hypothetical protein GEV33_004529 [Tenebrio molitor]|uniref:Brix domain-containing protein n=1 Tax=Tenebrio molitor TaxID=7067 RepID=A0A8J6HPZ1_TENMO|nr:hypothetical protein GEV33_004529 [Tenebrio molitor]